MKLTSLLIAALSLPVAAFAATGHSTPTEIKGEARFTGGKPVTIGSIINEGEAVELNTKSSIVISMPNGGSVTLGPKTRVQFRQLSQADDAGHYSYELILLRGTISGNAGPSAGSSSFAITTTAGTANVAGTNFDISFQPETTTGGIAKVRSSSGLINFTPSGSTAPIQIGANNETTVRTGDANPPVVVAAGPSAPAGSPVVSSTAAPAKDSGATEDIDPRAAKVTKWKQATLPDFSLLVVSPNGNL